MNWNTKYLVIINPQAGGGKGEGRWRHLRENLEREGVVFDERHTSQPGEGTLITREAVKQGYKTIVAVGGDGTLNEALNGLLDGDRLIKPDVRLGHIGLGSSNDFLRSVPKSDDSLLSKETVVDVVRIDCQSTTGSPISRYYVLNSSLGVVSSAIEKFNDNSRFRKTIRRVNPDLAVLFAGVSTILHPQVFHCSVSLDRKKWFEGESSSFAVIKSPHLGGGMNYGVDFKLDDGKVTVLVFDGMTRVQMLKSIKQLYDGTVGGKSSVKIGTASRVVINAQNTPPIEADGEIIGMPPARYTVRRRLVTILT